MSDNQPNDSEKTTMTQTPDDRTQAVSVVDSGATQYAMNVECPVCQTKNSASERYCTDCGFLLSESPVEVTAAEIPKTPAKLVSLDGLREFPLNSGANTVGRADSDVLLTDSSVSRKHAVVSCEGGKVFVEDAGSTNGTKAGGARVEQGGRVEVQDGAEFVFGGVVLKLVITAVVQETVAEDVSDEVVAEASTAETPAATEIDATTLDAETVESEEPQLPEDVPVALFALASKDGSLRYDLVKGTHSVGRRVGENDIVISDQYCSGKHAELTVIEESVTVKDIGSTNGTMVNSVKLAPNAPVILKPGDEVTFGQTPLLLEAMQNEPV